MFPLIENLLGVGALIGSVIVNLAVAFAAYYIASQFAADPDDYSMPDVSNYPLQTSMKSGPIPKVYGTRRVAGNIIWAGPPIPYEEEIEIEGGKGSGDGNSPATVITKYRRSFLIAICEGPASLLNQWVGKDALSADTFTFFEGLDNTGIRALTGEDYGDWKNLCCAFFEDYDLGTTESIPNYTFEIGSGLTAYPTLQIADGTFQTRYTAPTLTQDTPISNATDLQNMKNDLTGNYYLTGDIDCSGIANFEPIGTQANPFTGTFDGCSYTISNLNIDRATTDFVGLFGYLSASGGSDVIIKDVTLSGCDITGDNGTGGLIGLIGTTGGGDEVKVYNCHTAGNIKPGTTGGTTGMGGICGDVASATKSYFYDCTTSCSIDVSGGSASAYREIGGFIGVVNSIETEFYNCRATGDITGDLTDDEQIGGFIGLLSYNGCVFQDCHADGNVTGTFYIGGFIGQGANAAYTRCSSHGDVTSAEETIGGFVGRESGTTTTFIDCYAWGNINQQTANGYALGGFAGDVDNAVTFTNCYAIGAVSGDTSMDGGFVGWDYSGATYTACFFDTETTGLSSDGNNGGAVGHVTSWMQSRSNYEAAGYDFTTTWEIVSDYNDMNPADIIEDIIENTRYGVGDTTILDDTSLTAAHDYWETENMLISVVLNETRPWIDWVDYILSHAGGLRYNSGGKLHIGVLKSESALAALTDDDIVQPDADSENPPPNVDISTRPKDDTFNRVELSWTDRNNKYDNSVAVAYDAVDVARTGSVRKKKVKLSGICNAALAKRIAWRFLIDGLYRFNFYRFSVTFANSLLEVNDVITVSDNHLLSAEKVRIMNIEEAENGRDLKITAMDDYAELYPDVSAYSDQDSLWQADPTVTLADVTVNFRENYEQAKIHLSVTPANAYFNGGYVYMSRDDISYQLVGKFGVAGVTSGLCNSAGTVSSGSIPAHGSMTWRPDEYIYVDIGTVTDLKTDVTEDEFWHDRYLAKIGSEIIAFKDAEETAVAGIWKISNLRRGLFGTVAAAHSSGESFCTLVSDMTYNYAETDIGQSLYFKVIAYYGRNYQIVSDVSSFSTTVNGWYRRPGPASLLRLSADENDNGYRYSGSSFTLYWNNPENESPWDILSDGEPLSDNTEDSRLNSITLKFEQTDGTAIGQREIDVAEQATITKATDLGGFNDAVIKVVPRIVYGSRLENSLTVSQV